MDITAFLHHLESQPAYDGQVAHVEHIPLREASYAELDEPLADGLADPDQPLWQLHTLQANDEATLPSLEMPR